ncbi:MAG TPA: type III-A CRISPR-associated protein Csm2 [bacterium]|nr:type III-A CRISPR-associated protein Csm2 [bacterium]HQL64033.1 type III-A CRISPR-associated protein Csm2 [bacterium]
MSRRNYQDHDRRDQNLSNLWPGYLAKGYFDDKGHLWTEYVGREKVEHLAEAMANAYPPLNKHQLRRFFQHCRRIEARLKSKSASWAEVYPDVKKLDIAAADGFGKSSRKIPELFYEFIKMNVAKVNLEKDFLEGFLPHFEALVGFGSLHFKERERS